MSTIRASGLQSLNSSLDTRKHGTVGEKLLALCNKVAPLQRDLTSFEDVMLGEYCIACACGDRLSLIDYNFQGLEVLLKARRYKLVLLLLRKLQGRAPDQFLGETTAILPLSIAWYFQKEEQWQLWPGTSASDEFVDVVKLLIENGADVNAVDNHGNTPLFYACMLGHHELFRRLLDKGAATSTTHTFFSWRPVTAVNLLQATLEAFVWNEIDRPRRGIFPWEDHDSGRRQIIGDLLDAGQQSSPDDPRMVQLLQTACFQGHISWVKRFIEYGVPIDAPTTRENPRGRFYACSLHAAAAGGYAVVVQLLLDSGGRPSDKGLSTCAHKYRGDRKTREQTALAVVIDETSVASEDSPLKSQLWETCLVLMEAGGLPEDHVKLLEISVRDGKVTLVKRLLEMGYRLAQVPETRAVEIIQLLIQHGSTFDPRQAQKRAVQRGDCRHLGDLFRTWGNLLTFDELWRSWSATSTIGMDMLDTILSVHSVNDIFSNNGDADGEPVTLVQMACRRGTRASVEFLLNKGANLYLPEPENNALTALKRRLTTPRRRAIGSLGTGYTWELLQLLELHMPKEGRRIRDRCRIKAQRHKPVLCGGKHQSSKRRPYPGAHETQLRLPVEKIDGDEFEHTPLSGRDEIRTVILHPSKDPGAVIECEVVHCALWLVPEYEVLSYVWGDSTVPRYIRVKDKVLRITPDLHEALLALRRVSEPRHLWVDVVCTNQRDAGERNQQRELMGDIYMSAARVVIWLGNASEDSHLVFQHISRFRQHQDDVDSGRCRPTDPIGESHINMPLYAGATYEAVERLFRRPWFFRIWVIQEKVLSKEALVCCGPDSASWNDIFRGVGFPTGLTDRPLHGPNYRDRACRIHKLRPSDSFRQLFQYSRDCQVTDPKDRIYGILGILEPGLIQVNYKLDVQEIYRSFTRAVIQSSNSLEFLNLCGTKHTLPGLPSWVPDFSTRRSSCHLPGLADMRGRHTFGPLESHLNKALPGLRFRNHGRDLIVRGKAVDVVRAVGNEMPVSKEYDLGTENFAQILSQWESLAIEGVSNQALNPNWTSADPQSSASSAFLATIVALDTFFQDEPPQAKIGGVLWYKQHGSGALMKIESQYFDDVECSEVLGADEDESVFGRDFDRSYQWYTRQLELAIYGRKLFVTEGGLLGLANPEVQPGDEIVFLPGSPYPFVIRNIDGSAFKLMGDCYLYGFHVLKLFQDDEKPIEEYVFK